MQAAADARQDVTQKREGFGTIAGDSAKRYPFLRGGDRLAAVMLANFQFIIFRRETVILIAIGQLAGEGREVILTAVTAIGLLPGEHLAYRLDREVRKQAGDPGAGADQQLFTMIFTVEGIDGDPVSMVMNSRDRTVE